MKINTRNMKINTRNILSTEDYKRALEAHRFDEGLEADGSEICTPLEFGLATLSFHLFLVLQRPFLILYLESQDFSLSCYMINA